MELFKYHGLVVALVPHQSVILGVSKGWGCSVTVTVFGVVARPGFPSQTNC